MFQDLNEVNITVEAAIDSASSPDCGSPGSADGYKDTLVKQIQVTIQHYKMIVFREAQVLQIWLKGIKLNIVTP